MTESTRTQERRSEKRQSTGAKRISWTRDGATKTSTGWVSDVATTSVAFVTPTRDLPDLGEALDLTLNAEAQFPKYHHVRVARTQPYDRFFSLVACRFDAEDALTPTR